MNFKNKVVVITGASSGIGEAAAEQFAKKGANIVLVARRKEKLEQVEKKLSKYSTKILVQVCDVSDKEQVKQMSEKVIEIFSKTKFWSYGKCGISWRKLWGTWYCIILCNKICNARIF